jgi:hypothetical protein
MLHIKNKLLHIIQLFVCATWEWHYRYKDHISNGLMMAATLWSGPLVSDSMYQRAWWCHLPIATCSLCEQMRTFSWPHTARSFIRTCTPLHTARFFDMLHCHIFLICYIDFVLLHFFDVLHCHIALICYIVFNMSHCFDILDWFWYAALLWYAALPHYPMMKVGKVWWVWQHGPILLYY